VANANLLEMRGICKTYAGVPVLDSVDFRVSPGEVHALMGENGAGKSTLMKILMGIVPRNAGEIILDGRAVTFRSPREAMDGGLAMIHQELNPVLDLEVAENIFLGREVRSLSLGPLSTVNRRRMRQDCQALFDRFGIPLSPTAMMRELSVAQMQLVEIVKAISLSSKVVIMDEPTSAITEREVAILFRQIGLMREHGVSVIYISHKIEEVFQIADRITVLRDGRVAGADVVSAMDRDALIKLMVGREITNFLPKETVPIGEVALEVRGLTWGRRVLDVSFAVRAGEILGLAGLVGAGRSETVETLFGMHKASAGEIRIRDRQVAIRSPRGAIKRRIALITEDRKMTGLNLVGTVEENISLAALDRVSRFGMIRKRREHACADEYIQRMNIKTFSRAALVSSLSGGNQQKVVLAKWLLTDPDVVIFDEPTRGIDVGAKREIYLLIGELVKQGKAVVLISSELLEIMGLADRILVMAAGRLTGEVQRRDFSQERIMELAARFNEVEHG
jgi:ribose transport system ATP-binding protein/inositol transport system ATP-binding protein